MEGLLRSQASFFGQYLLLLLLNNSYEELQEELGERLGQTKNDKNRILYLSPLSAQGSSGV